MNKPIPLTMEAYFSNFNFPEEPRPEQGRLFEPEAKKKKPEKRPKKSA